MTTWRGEPTKADKLRMQELRNTRRQVDSFLQFLKRRGDCLQVDERGITDAAEVILNLDDPRDVELYMAGFNHAISLLWSVTPYVDDDLGITIGSMLASRYIALDPYMPHIGGDN